MFHKKASPLSTEMRVMARTLADEGFRARAEASEPHAVRLSRYPSFGIAPYLELERRRHPETLPKR